MSEIVHADIFFFITSTAVILVSMGMLAILYHLFFVARDVRAMVAKARRAGEEIEKDFETLRANLRDEGVKGKAIIDMVLGFVTRKLHVPPVRRKKKEASSSEE